MTTKLIGKKNLSNGNSCNIAEIDDKYPSPEPRNKHLLKVSARVNQQRNQE
jgi:hypothetical protein